MDNSLKLAEMQRTNIEFERQRHLANWLIKSSPHMAIPSTGSTAAPSAATAATSTPAGATSSGSNASGNLNGTTNNSTSNNTPAITAQSHHPHPHQHQHQHSHQHPHQHQLQFHQHHSSSKHGNSVTAAGGVPSNGANNPVFYLMASNGNASAVGHHAAVTTTVANMTPSGKHGGPSVPHTHPHPHPHVHHLHPHHHHPQHPGLAHVVEGRKPKLRRFNSHDTSSNMFSVADFENARLARRNEIEMKQRLARRMRNGFNGAGVGGGGLNASGLLSGITCGAGLLTGGSLSGDYSTGDSKASKHSNDSQQEPLPVDVFLERYSLPRVVRISYKTKFSNETLQSSSSNASSTVTSHSSASGGGTAGISATNGGGHSTDTSAGTNTGTSSSTGSSSANVVLNNNTITTVGSSDSNSSGTKNANSSATSAAVGGGQSKNGTEISRDTDEQGELFLLYRLVRQRHIYHGHNAKTAVVNRKKGVLIPQEFPGYFSLINDKGLPTATLYTSLVQLVRERVCKFVSVDNMPAFTESQPAPNASSPTEGCLHLYTASAAATNRPQYVKTTARGGQVFKLLAVYEDGKQDHSAFSSCSGGGDVGGSGGMGGIGCGAGGGGLGSGVAKASVSHGREKEKGRYAQLLNENRQMLYVSLATKGKFYEIEPGIPQILQKRLDVANDANKKINPDCVHRLTALVSPNKELPVTLRYISGPNGCASAIPENICITRITTENVIIACPIEDVEMQSPLHLRKLHLTKEMNLLKSSLGFESEQRMLANPNVQNILRFCQFNCDQFLKMVEVEVLSRTERSASKSRVDGLKILKPLHFPKLLRREKTTMSAHEKEDSIIFLSKSDLANMEAKEQQQGFNAHCSNANRISEKMKVFQSTKKKWFRKQDKQANVNSLSSLDLDVQAKRMSMERYTDMSKLLQERFGDKPNTAIATANERGSISEPSGGASDIVCSDTETTTLATIEEKLRNFSTSKLPEPNVLQKSMSLQDIELFGGSRKPDLLTSHTATGDTISEAGTDLDDLENREPVQHSFITEKLYNEFHVKTRQYSKSSSSLHQLLNFSLPQKLQVHDTKRSLAQLKQQQQQQQQQAHNRPPERRLEFNIGEPVTGRRAAGGLSLLAPLDAANSVNSQNTSLISPLTPISLIEDDLPYSSVRDSLILSSDECSPPDQAASNICQALHLIDYTKENIYAEICHDARAMGGIPSSQTRDTFTGDTHSTQISDDYGDYASLTYPAQTNGGDADGDGDGNGDGDGGAGGDGEEGDGDGDSGGSVGVGVASAISRVQITCSPRPVSYHTVYVGDEALGEQHVDVRRVAGRESRPTQRARESRPRHTRDRAHVTTVELAGTAVQHDVVGRSEADAHEAVAASASGGLDNIYNTLK